MTFLDSKSSQMGKVCADTAKVLDRLHDGIEYRGLQPGGCKRSLPPNAGVPVWNSLTDVDHPTQILADSTIEEHITESLFPRSRLL